MKDQVKVKPVVKEINVDRNTKIDAVVANLGTSYRDLRALRFPKK